ncbi:hypothetical protein Hanom_Chr15g01376571 [Helianthus anomalus]
MGFQIPPSPKQDQFYKEKLPNSIPFHSMKRTLPYVQPKKITFFLLPEQHQQNQTHITHHKA